MKKICLFILFSMIILPVSADEYHYLTYKNGVAYECKTPPNGDISKCKKQIISMFPKDSEETFKTPTKAESDKLEEMDKLKKQAEAIS